MYQIKVQTTDRLAHGCSSSSNWNLLLTFTNCPKFISSLIHSLSLALSPSQCDQKNCQMSIKVAQK